MFSFLGCLHFDIIFIFEVDFLFEIVFIFEAISIFEGAGYGAGSNVSWLATQEWGARHGVKLASLITSLVFGFLCIHLPTKLCNARSEHLAGSPGEEARHGAGYAHHIFDLFFPLQPLFSLPLIKYLT